jgi:hypothetical protein
VINDAAVPVVVDAAGGVTGFAIMLAERELGGGDAE